MKILLIYSNINVSKDTWFSFGLASIIAVLRQHGFDTKLRILFNESDYAKILEDIKKDDPKVIGFSTVASQFRFVKKAVAEVRKQYPDKIMVCGGVHPTLFPECLHEAPELTGVFRGESEFSFLDFVKKIRDDKPYHDTTNFAYVNSDGKLHLNPLRPLIQNLDVLPFPDIESFDYEQIVKASNGRVRFLFNRGCPNLCSFCSNHALAKTYGLPTFRPRYRSPQLAIKEIVRIKERFDLKYVFIVDEIFGLDRKWLLEFCTLYKKQVGIPFECFQRANVFDLKTAEALKRAGCTNIDFGVESGNDYIRNEIMKRYMKRETMVKAFKICRDVGLKATAANIIGLPFETKEMIMDTVRLNRELLPDSSIAGIFYPYPGTELEKVCRENNLIIKERIEDPNFIERKKGTVLKLEVSDNDLIHIFDNWQKLVYRDPLTMLKYPKRLVLDPFFRKAKIAIKNPKKVVNKIAQIIKKITKR